MKYTVAAYLQDHPRTMLANSIKALNLHPRKELYIGRGLITDNPISNLQRAITETGWNNVLIGGRAGQNRNDGHWFALYR